MAESGKEKGQHYEALKQRLWNQPRPRQFMERLERHGARLSLLEWVAGLFVSGKHGEAEVLAAMYGDLLRHQDQREVQKRMADLRVMLVHIHQDLLFLTHELPHIRDWDTIKRTLGLSEDIIHALNPGRPVLSADEGPPGPRFRSPWQTAAHHGEAPWTLIIKLQRVAVLKRVLARLSQHLLGLVDELFLFRRWKAYRTAGYEEFYQLTKEQLGLPDTMAQALILAREQADRVEPAQLLEIVLQGDGFLGRPGREEAVNA